MFKVEPTFKGLVQVSCHDSNRANALWSRGCLCTFYHIIFRCSIDIFEVLSLYKYMYEKLEKV